MHETYKSDEIIWSIGNDALDVYSNSLSEIYKLSPSNSEYVSACLNFIAERINAGAMCALVGAGFSKNANEKFPSWAELFVDAYREMNDEVFIKTHKNSIIKKISNQGESAFAEKYEHFKGKRESLDCYIEDKLLPIDTDKNNKLDLHHRLLDIKWTDIITTNWDTLLERANIKNNKYQVIKEAKKLKVDNKNRILKIHGTLRTDKEIDNNEYNFDSCDEHLYVVTESDFKNYSIQHESFSNFMKIKILENSFCLFGFSGNDPNFLFWIKELKRTMTKGGSTELPNPIFLIDVSDKTPDKAMQQFYKNNYIIRLSLYEIKSHINANIKNNSFENNLGSYDIVAEGRSELSSNKISSMYSDFLELLKKSTSYDSLSSEQLDSIKSAREIFRIITRSDGISENTIAKYNNISLFLYDNLYYTSYSISYIQGLANSIDKWTEDTFDFIYRWCMSNFYSLPNLYEKDTTEKIIEKFENDIFRDSKCSKLGFSELILKYYREHNYHNEFGNLYNKLSVNEYTKNIAMYQRALFYHENFKYKKLKDFLANGWLPENDTEKNILHITRKISLLLAFENISMLDDNEKNKIKELFNIAINEVKTNRENFREPQLAYFVCLYFSYYKNNVFYYDTDNELNELINYFQKDYTSPQKFIDAIFEKSKSNSVKPNDSTRYSVTIMSYDDPRDDYFRAIRCLNFFEYTGLPSRGILQETKFFDLIDTVKDNGTYFLGKILLHSLLYSGNSASEDFLCAVTPKILRYFPNKLLNNLFREVFSIVKYKIKNKRNAKVYIFFLSEFLKRVGKKQQQDFVAYFFNKIQEKERQVVSSIQRGYTWGWKKPLKLFIQLIEDADMFREVLLWVMDEYTKDVEESINMKTPCHSDFLDYYVNMLVTVEKFTTEKKHWFSEDSDFKKLIALDMGQTKKLALYAYDYLDEETKLLLNNYLENNYTMQIDPYFISKVKSKAVKEKCLNIICNYNILRTSSIDFSLIKYVKILFYSKLLDLNDKKRLADNMIEKYNYYIANTNNPINMYIKYNDTLDNLFFSVAEITSEEERKNNSDLQNAYEILKKAYEQQNADMLKFDWLYTSDFYKFRVNFISCISCLSYLKIAKENINIINLAISKIIVCDSEEFEAVLEQIIIMYENKYENDILNNDMTVTLLLQLLAKFRINNIPSCYDDLFIKKQMKKLSALLQKNNIKNQNIDYWLQEK